MFINLKKIKIAKGKYGVNKWLGHLSKASEIMKKVTKKKSNN